MGEVLGWIWCMDRGSCRESCPGIEHHVTMDAIVTTIIISLRVYVFKGTTASCTIDLRQLALFGLGFSFLEA